MRNFPATFGYYYILVRYKLDRLWPPQKQLIDFCKILFVCSGIYFHWFKMFYIILDREYLMADDYWIQIWNVFYCIIGIMGNILNYPLGIVLKICQLLYKFFNISLQSEILFLIFSQIFMFHTWLFIKVYHSCFSMVLHSCNLTRKNICQ